MALTRRLIAKRLKVKGKRRKAGRPESLKARKVRR